jgi:hypothetical protein
MPFISRNKLNDLQDELAELRLDKMENALDFIKFVKAEADLDQIYDFLAFLQNNVPDYEGYVLRYIEEQEDDSPEDHL